MLSSAIPIASESPAIPAIPAVAVAPVNSAVAGFQVPRPHDQPWRLQSLVEDAGLAGHRVLDVGFEPDGTAWLATSDGLRRYDGYAWRRYTTADGLPSDFVRCVAVTRAGELWVGTVAGAGAFDPERGFDARGTAGRLAAPSVRSITEEPDGTLWLACDQWPDRTVEGGLTRLASGTLRTWRQTDGLPHAAVLELFRTSDGRRYALTTGGLARLDEDRVRLPLVEAKLPFCEHGLTAMVELADGRLVVAGRWALFVHGADGWKRRPISGDDGRPMRLLRTEDGAVLSARVDGGLRFTELGDGGFHPVTETLPGAWSDVDVLAEAPDGSIWAAGFGLLLRWERRGGEWTVYENTPPPYVRDARDHLWFVDRTRAVRLEDERFVPEPRAAVTVWPGPDGRVWTSTRGLVHAWDGASWETLGPDVTGIGAPRQLDFDGAGVAWLCGHDLRDREGLARFDGESWARVAIPVLPRTQRIARTWPDPVEGMWYVVNGYGNEPHHLLRVRGTEALEVAVPPAVGRYEVPEIHVDRSGAVWAYGLFGAFRSRDGGATWTEVEAMRGRHVHFVVECGEALWFANTRSPSGGGRLDRLVDGRWSSYPVVVSALGGRPPRGPAYFTTPEGVCEMPTDPADGPRLVTVPGELVVESVVRGPDGDLWVGGQGTVLRYRADGVPPETVLAGTRATFTHGEDHVVGVRGVERFRPRDAPARFRVSMRYDGGAWTPFELLPEDGLRLAAPAVGEHVLEVRVQDEGLDVDPTPLVHRFRVQPVPLQSRWWFAPLVGATFLVILALAVTSLAAKRKLAGHARDLGVAVRHRTAELEVSERRYRALFEQAHHAILLADARGVIGDANRAAARLLGTTRSRLAGRPVRDLFTDPEEAREHEAQLLASGTLSDVPGRLRTLDGEEREVIVAANLLRDEDGVVVGYQAQLRDVTRQRQIEQRLRQSQKMEAVGRLAGGIAHDFNNILTIIVGHVDLLAMDVGDDPARADLDTILEAVQRARHLTTQLQTFGRGQVVQPRVVDLNEIVSDTHKLLRRVIGEDVELAISLDAGACPVWMDPGQLEQILMNLAVNARDAMPEGGRLTMAARKVELDPDGAAEHSAPAPGAYAMLEVGDTGQGMDTATQQRIFEPFFTTKPEGKGTGLGLATVYGIVKQAGGGLSVTSEPDAGSRFRVVLPVCEAVETVRVPEPEPPREADGGRETVLLVEDETDIRRMLEQLLDGWGYRVLSASNGTEALERAHAAGRGVDLLLTDIVMPGMNGRELANRLRADEPRISVLFMSGYDGTDPAGRARWNGDDAVLMKPFSPAAMKIKVREVLDRR